MKNYVSDSGAVILAAGEGKRMGGQFKPMIEIGGQSILGRLHISVINAKVEPITVISRQAKKIFESSFPERNYKIQEIPTGTADALMTAKDALKNAKRILVLYGDHPFITTDTINKLFNKSKDTGAEITLATARIIDFEGDNKIFVNFGRVIRENNKIKKIKEFKDASDQERNIKEINPGYYVFKSDWLWSHLEKIENRNVQGEKYITDLIYMAERENLNIEDIQIDPREAMGANSPEELEILKKFAVQ